jgi:BASS family bile acid:Na+ symporter
MLGLGLSLSRDDFVRVIRRPLPLAVGLGLHLLVLPAVCFVIVHVSGLPERAALGMMLAAASPVGMSAVL